MVNVTLLRRDSYFVLLKSGVKFDTVTNLTQWHSKVRAIVFEARNPTTHSDWQRVILFINDSYWVPKWDYIEMISRTESCQTFCLNVETLSKTLENSCQTSKVETLNQTLKKSCQTLNVNCVIADPVHFVTGVPQKKGVSPSFARPREKLKYFMCKFVVFCPKCHKCP